MFKLHPSHAKAIYARGRYNTPSWGHPYPTPGDQMGSSSMRQTKKKPLPVLSEVIQKGKEKTKINSPWTKKNQYEVS